LELVTWYSQSPAKVSARISWRMIARSEASVAVLEPAEQSDGGDDQRLDAHLLVAVGDDRDVRERHRLVEQLRHEHRPRDPRRVVLGGGDDAARAAVVALDEERARDQGPGRARHEVRLPLRVDPPLLADELLERPRRRRRLAHVVGADRVGRRREVGRKNTSPVSAARSRSTVPRMTPPSSW
jgi:hypothetical protein